MFKVCTKSLGFLRATKNIKIVCSLLFSVRWEKSKVQTPYALKNAKLVWFSTKDYILRFYSFI